jgi:hypothetical protein
MEQGVFHSRDVPFPRDVDSLLDVSFLWGVFHSRDVPFPRDVDSLLDVSSNREPTSLGKGTSLEWNIPQRKATSLGKGTSLEWNTPF